MASALVVTVFSMLGGYSLARYKFKGKQTIILFFLVTQMIPGILVIIPLYIIFSKMGLINTHIGLFIFYVTANLPFCVITMRSFFERIPVTLEEAARVDGCTKMQSLFKIVFPIMFPGIVRICIRIHRGMERADCRFYLYQHPGDVDDSGGIEDIDRKIQCRMGPANGRRCYGAAAYCGHVCGHAEIYRGRYDGRSRERIGGIYERRQIGSDTSWGRPKPVFKCGGSSGLYEFSAYI